MNEQGYIVEYSSEVEITRDDEIRIIGDEEQHLAKDIHNIISLKRDLGSFSFGWRILAVNG